MSEAEWDKMKHEEGLRLGKAAMMLSESCAQLMDSMEVPTSRWATVIRLLVAHLGRVSDALDNDYKESACPVCIERLKALEGVVLDAIRRGDEAAVKIPVEELLRGLVPKGHTH